MMSTKKEATSLKNVFWVYPERNTARQREFEERRVWAPYRKVLESMGYRFGLVKPDDIHIEFDHERSVCFVNDARVTPRDTIFVTSMWTMPHQVVDTCNQLFLYSALETLGFFLPIPLKFANITVDKMATYLHLRECPVRHLPTSRIAAGRDVFTKDYAVAVANVKYPALVKPSYWAMGIGVCIAHNPEELHGLVGLARGADTAVVVQPFLSGASDYRVYVVNGEPVLIMKRSPRKDSLTANLATGGTAEYTKTLPSELRGSIDYIASRLPMPYMAMDFLHDGERFWFSEIEPDGALVFDKADELTDAMKVEAATKRFQAFVDGHSAHCAELNQ
ncbi:hypothetical protein ACVIW2_003894 [Bradyrhizobium huanghuaihaiense]|uniref:RimK-like ATP-grasp domain-containing protein n=1 Tax=Bradyrhizobium huanghuaihaiense TaxID=990078 RepID=A0A562R5H8_9BRAD|nr:hypothetical protein [Bradyrhizobium huanghuaihaiense]TWI63804.1 RimK-like ATP-grasp domain-containing protein [Bradyrhizobium huanghuaihaiense]